MNVFRIDVACTMFMKHHFHSEAFIALYLISVRITGDRFIQHCTQVCRPSTNLSAEARIIGLYTKRAQRFNAITDPKWSCPRCDWWAAGWQHRRQTRQQIQRKWWRAVYCLPLWSARFVSEIIQIASFTANKTPIWTHQVFATIFIIIIVMIIIIL